MSDSVHPTRIARSAAAVTSSGWQVWRWPIALGLLTASGLVTALVSDAWGDAWSWLALGVPLAVIVWHALRRPAARRLPNPSTPSRERR